MNFEELKLTIPDGCNVILGHSHFIKTVEDLYEVLITGCSSAKFGLAFSEASGPCLVRVDGNDEELKKSAAQSLIQIGCGHTFIIYLKNSFPINFLNAIKNVSEVCRIHCATANPIIVLIARMEQGGAIIGVVDGASPKGIEDIEYTNSRKKFLRDIGYKR